MDKVREEFEEWAKQFFKLGVEDWGEYVDYETQWAWTVWKASRESIVVKIPKEGEASSFGKYVVYDYELVVKMLEEAGVHYEYE